MGNEFILTSTVLGVRPPLILTPCILRSIRKSPTTVELACIDELITKIMPNLTPLYNCTTPQLYDLVGRGLFWFIS
jgi:hypothetical protein